jgi:hypothetical protein
MPVPDANLIVYLRTPETQGEVEIVAVEVPGQGMIDAPTSNLRTSPEQVSHIASFHVVKSGTAWYIHFPDCSVWWVGREIAGTVGARRAPGRTQKTKAPSVRKRSRR